jgi:hypothetical protein
VLASFVPTEMLGSQGNSYVMNFDQVSFITGPSSSLWNEFNSSVSIASIMYISYCLILYRSLL